MHTKVKFMFKNITKNSHGIQKKDPDPKPSEMSVPGPKNHSGSTTLTEGFVF